MFHVARRNRRRFDRRNRSCPHAVARRHARTADDRHAAVLSEETKLRDQICEVSTSLFERCLTAGSTGNISARLSDGSTLTTPTNASLGRLDPARLSLLSPDGTHVK